MGSCRRPCYGPATSTQSTELVPATCGEALKYIAASSAMASQRRTSRAAYAAVYPSMGLEMAVPGLLWCLRVPELSWKI